MKKQVLILLILITKICCSQTKPLLSIKELFAEPLYYLRNDTLFTVDVDNNMLICQDSSVVYRLKLFAGNETTLKKYPGYEAISKMYPSQNFKIPYTDISAIVKRVYTLPNLQYLDMNYLQLWKFPKEILRLEKLQILKMESISFDDRTETIYHADTIPPALWQMKHLKHLSLYIDYDDAGKPFIPYFNESDNNPKTRQYVPDGVKFTVNRYISMYSDLPIKKKIQNAWIDNRKEKQNRNKDLDAYIYGLQRLKKIFGENFLIKCECE